MSQKGPPLKALVVAKGPVESPVAPAALLPGGQEHTPGLVARTAPYQLLSPSIHDFLVVLLAVILYMKIK